MTFSREKCGGRKFCGMSKIKKNNIGGMKKEKKSGSKAWEEIFSEKLKKIKKSFDFNQI